MTHTGILRTVNRFMNGTTATGDALPGQSVGGYAGQPPQYAGQLGAYEFLNFTAAQKFSDFTTAPNTSLQGGKYQYVQYAADGTVYAQGQVLYWKDETNYIVTNVAPLTTSANVAGIAVSPVVQGNYWFVQTTGVAYVLYRATVTSTTVSTGVYVLVNTATADALTDATADATVGVNKLFIGIAKDAPSNAGVKRVYLKGLTQVE